MARLINIIYMLIIYLHGCWSSRPPPSSPPNSLFSVKINCTRELFNIKLDMGKPFKGIIFAKDFLDECRSRGNVLLSYTFLIENFHVHFYHYC